MASVTRALRTGFLAVNLVVRVDGKSINIEIMLLAACRRKLSNFTSGKGMSVGKK